MRKTYTQPIVDYAKAAGKVRAALALRGWKVHNLAEALGLKSATVSNLISGTNRGKSTRQKIEDILGVAAWSSESEFFRPPKVNCQQKPTNQREDT